MIEKLMRGRENVRVILQHKKNFDQRLKGKLTSVILLRVELQKQGYPEKELYSYRSCEVSNSWSRGDKRVQIESYSLVICMLRCKLVFAMMRSALVCLHGSRSLKPNKCTISSAMSLDTPASVVLHETRLC